jgi:mRNA-degrading endonuclease RelE of RelBE toxin-antitoxin system
MEKTAKSEFKRLKKENAKLLKLIGAELENQASENPHYGDVGDLEHSKKLLIEILAFQRNAFDELDIETELL